MLGESPQVDRALLADKLPLTDVSPSVNVTSRNDASQKADVSPLEGAPLMDELIAISKDDPKKKAFKKLERRYTPRQRVIREAVELAIIIAAAVALTLLVRTFILDTYEIPTGSMEPTIEISDRIFAEKISFRFSSPTPGDIVTFYDPIIEGRVLIKRCIAVGGQEVNLVNGKVVVDGVVLDEPYTYGKPSNELDPMPGLEIEYPYRVPRGMVWVMGDNRTNSSDSRYFGPVPEEEFIGRALFRFLPFSRFGKIE